MELNFDEAAARGLRRYTELVTWAVGQGDGGSYVQLEPPVSVYLALDRRLPRAPTQDAALLWDERYGWALAVEPNGAEDLRPVAYLGGDLLPRPAVVANFVTGLTGGQDVGQSTPPRPRPADDLAQRLATYTEPTWDIQPAGDSLLTVRVVRQAMDVVLLHVAGELDLLTAPRLRESVARALAERPRLLILDLTDVRFLGSAGLSVLINAHENARSDTRLRVVAGAPAVLRPLDVTGLAATLSIHPTLGAAFTDVDVSDQLT
jgi:anti-anti-sigma factor